MKKTIKFISLVLSLMMLMSSIVIPQGFAFAATAGAISSVTNNKSGVVVKWTKDSNSKGYNVYRRNSGYKSWTKITNVTTSATTSWTDTTAENGKAYNYRVASYNATKETENSEILTICRLNTPSISLNFVGDSICVKTNNNDSVSGYEIVYSKFSDYANPVTVSVSGKQLSKTIANLPCSQTYYFKVRAYRVLNSGKFYSGYSVSKSIKTKAVYTAYTIDNATSVYEKPNSNSNKVKLDCNTKVTLYEDYSISSSGIWKKLKYSSKYYYAYIASGTKKFRTTNYNNVYGTISSASNCSTGIKIKWTTSTTVDGYVIYRKFAGYSTWNELKKITDKTVSTFTDTTAENGKKYDYKVCAYRGKEDFNNTKFITNCRIKTPVMTLGFSGDSIQVKTDTNDSVSGYQIDYSTNSDFSGSISVSVSTKQLSKVIANLTCSKKYYFRVRAYKISNDVKYYGGYCSAKSITTKAAYTAYTVANATSIYTEANSNSTRKSLNCNTKVTLYQDYSVSSSGVWKKLKYDNAYYYTWIPAGEERFSLVNNDNRYGAISSATNSSTGVTIKWATSTTIDGYVIYRKSSSSSAWTEIKKITDKTVSTFTDTTAENGKKYDYKVCAYKGKTNYNNTKYKTICRLDKPVIASISSYDIGAFAVESSQNDSASGFEIVYSKSSDFTNNNVVSVSGKKIDKIVCDLTPDSTYYVKIRAYKISNDVKYYGVYSAYKKVVTGSSYTAYTFELNTSLYDAPNTSSSKTTIGYMSEVEVCSVYSASSQGTWQKVIYNGKEYYFWKDPGQEKFTKIKNDYKYDLSCCSVYQQEVVNMALDIFFNVPNQYDFDKTHSNGEVNENTGKTPYDCSGLVRHVFNTVMVNYVKSYSIPWNITELAATTSIYNQGFDSEFSAKTVCAENWDASKLEPGDVIFFNLTEDDGKPIDHCAIYLGKNQFVHSTPISDGLNVIPMDDIYVRSFVKAVRFLPTNIDNCEINKTITASTWVSIYDDKSCRVGESKYKLKAGQTATLINLNSRTAYIEYTDENGEIDGGYVLNPTEKFLDVYDQ